MRSYKSYINHAIKENDNSYHSGVIRDLGYFSTSVLQTIAKQQAFFLSRLKSNVLVYDGNGNEVDFEKLYKEISRCKNKKCERRVLISKDQVPVRLYIGRVPDDVYQPGYVAKSRKKRKKGVKCRKGQNYY